MTEQGADAMIEVKDSRNVQIGGKDNTQSVGAKAQPEGFPTLDELNQALVDATEIVDGEIKVKQASPHYPMTTLEQTRLSLAQVGRDFMHDRITEAEWQEIRARLHARLNEFQQQSKSED